MPVHINSLPDDCLLTFFDRIPLADLLRIDRVCHRWASLLSSACARRRTLTLILCGKPEDETYFSIPFTDNLKISLDGGYSDLSVPERDASLTLPYLMPVTTFAKFLLDEYLVEDDGFFDILYRSSLGGPVEEELTELTRLHTAHLSGHLVNYLAELFPNVSTLVVIHVKCYEADLRSLIDLLGHWSLKIAKLWIRTCEIELKFEHRPGNHPIHTLLLSINRQASLEQLTLDFDTYSWTTNQFTIPLSNTFSFIGRLKVAKLNLGWYDGRNALWHSVQRFNNTELRQIGLGSEEDLLMETVLNSELQFTSKVRQLYFEWSFETVGQCGQFCQRFPSLTMLRVNWSRSNITFAQLVSNLASLQQLTHLKLDISFGIRHENPLALDRVDGDGGEPRRISLPQVKNLELEIYKRSHQDLEPLCPLVFPSVEEIVLWDYLSDCTTCQPYFNGPNDTKSGNRCHRLMILSLKDKFPSVRLYAKYVDYFSPFVDYTNYVRTVDDALPEIGGRNDDQPEEEQVPAW